MYNGECASVSVSVNGRKDYSASTSLKFVPHDRLSSAHVSSPLIMSFIIALVYR